MWIFDHSSRSAFVWLSVSALIHPSDYHCIQRFALHLLMYGLDSAAQLWKPIPWSSLHTVPELIWRPHEVWRSVASDSAESWRPLRTMRLSIRWPCSVILLDLPLRGWVAVIHSHFHFVIIPLTVDCGIFRIEEISQLEFSSWSDPFFHKCLYKQSACLGARFYTPVAMEVIGTPDFNYLDGWVNSFGNIVYHRKHRRQEWVPLYIVKKVFSELSISGSVYCTLCCSMKSIMPIALQWIDRRVFLSESISVMENRSK